MTERDVLVSRIFLRSALPLTKVLAEEMPPQMKYLFPKRGVVQFTNRERPDMSAALVFEDHQVDVEQGLHPNAQLTVAFKTLNDMNRFFGGKSAVPDVLELVKGARHLHLLLRSLPLLLGLKILMPDAKPKNEKQRALKVKLMLYMVTNALSQLNKGGDPEFCKLTKTSPDRVFQWNVTDGPAAYLRIKGGKSKAGRGVYTRRRPFVAMNFSSIEGAYKVLMSEVPLVEAVVKGYVVTEGAMEYSKEISYHMQRIEELTTSL